MNIFRICPGEWDVQISLGFLGKKELPKVGQITKPIDSRQKRACRIVDITVPADHKEK